MGFSLAETMRGPTMKIAPSQQDHGNTIVSICVDLFEALLTAHFGDRWSQVEVPASVSRCVFDARLISAPPPASENDQSPARDISTGQSDMSQYRDSGPLGRRNP